MKKCLRQKNILGHTAGVFYTVLYRLMLSAAKNAWLNPLFASISPKKPCFLNKK